MKTTLRGRTLTVCLLVLFLVPFAFADKPANQNRGFSADKVYAVGDIDSVNVFNGNLIVRIPLGQEYAVGPVLRYQFNLVYNSTIWDYRELLLDQEGRENDDPPPLGLRQAVPADYANAGMGWMISLGQLLLPNENREISYLGPDGAQHEFKNDFDDAAALFTEDGSYLRLRTVNDVEGSHYEVDFPDGTVRTFSITGDLQEIRDPFGNWVRVETQPNLLIVTDGHGTAASGREHRIEYASVPARIAPPGDDYPDQNVPVITRVLLAAPSPSGNSSQGTLEYDLEHTQRLIGRGGNADRFWGQPSKCLGVPLLESIELPDGSSYTPSYKVIPPGMEDLQCGTTPDDATDAPADSGTLQELVLPTRGRLAWDYHTVYLNESICSRIAGQPMAPLNGPKVKTRFVGVQKRKAYDSPTDTTPATWTYSSVLNDPGTQIFVTCGPKQEDKKNEGWVEAPAEELVTTIVAPGGLTTKHYFSIYPVEADGTLTPDDQPGSVMSGLEYGLPLSRKYPIAVAGKPTLYLSSETFDQGAPVRRSYVHYDVDFDEDHYRGRNSRVRDERTVFPADDDCGGAPCHTEVRRSLFDARGHYKQTESSSNFPGSSTRTTFVDYTTPAPSATPWILGLYGDSWETSSGDARTIRRNTVFNAGTGAMESVRTYAQTGNANDDLLSAWCRDGSPGDRGYVTGERSFGAGRSIPTTPCTAEQSPGDSFLDHEYGFTAGVLTSHKTRYADALFYTSDEEYDRHAGLLTLSRDTAGVATTYEYDDAMRLEYVRSPGVAPVHYEYERDAYPNSVSEITQEATDTKTDVHYFDGLGRPILSKAQIEDGWASTVTSYDDSGRVADVSMPELRPNSSYESFTPAYKTINTYDAQGRHVSSQQPDGKLTVTDYVGEGDREKQHKTKESAGATAVLRSTEEYDGAGRLVTVTEPSGPAGALVDTTYTYDVGGHLATVNTGSNVVTGGNTVYVEQERAFSYDLRGFLQSEQHPEKGEDGNGMVVYGDFDATGRARTKTEGTAVTKYTFDESGRLTRVRNGDDQDIKTFVFAPANDGANYRQGKLHVATRYNRLAGAGTIRVVETYSYAGRGGRMDARTTLVERQDGSAWTPIQTFTQGYTYEPDYGGVATIDYPACAGCTPAAGIGTLELEYTHGALTSVKEFATLAYHANGMVKTVQRRHPLTTVDRYESDHGMARPASIQFDDGDACRPVTSWPTNQTVNSGGTATFTASVVPGASVTWYAGASGDPTHVVRDDGAATFTTGALFTTARFWARVTLPGGCSVDGPTVLAEVCRLPEIVYPAAGLTPSAQPAQLGSPVLAEAMAVASGISYSWTAEQLDRQSNGTWTVVGSPETIPGANGPSVSWTPTIRGTGYWGLRVTVTGSCPGATAQSRLVKVVEIPTATTACAAPVLLGSLPPERRVWWPSHSINLDVSVQSPSTADDFVFEWSVNGQVVIQEEGENVFTTALHDLQPRLVKLRVWRDCSDPMAVPPTVVKSAIVERTTYLWTDENCPVPPLSVDQPELIATSTAAFTASSVWPSVDFQWYEGDSGNTSHPIDADPTSAGRRLTPGRAGTFWVRAVSKCGTTADSPTLIARGESCAPVQFIRQPAAHTYTDAGANVTLSYETYSNPGVLSQDWFVLGSSTSISANQLLTVNPKRTTTYYATAENGCNEGTSAPAMVHVTSCADINLHQAPQPASINEGDTVQLSVNATSAFPLTYQWYEGESGDVSHPVTLNGNGPLVELEPERSTKFWVRISVDVADGCAIDTNAVPVTVCRAPKFTGEVSEISSPAPGVMHWLEADVEGDNLSYAWYSGLAGNTTTLLSTGRSYMVHPMTTTEFWLRVTSDCAAPLADRSTDRQYRISVCPELVTEPYAVQPKVMPGTSATLVLEAVRGDLVEWYVGQTLVGTGATFQTAAINAATTFWARVTSGSCSIVTSPVTVSLCDQPTAGWNSASLRAGKDQQQTISVHHTTSGSAINFKFYAGTPGNVAQSTLLQSDVYPTLGVHPSTTTTYWVRAQEATGCHADTAGLVVDVCVPQITTQPQSKTIDPQTTTQLSVGIDLPASPRIEYRWYIGPVGNTSQPVSNGTTASIDVTPSATTTYWVRITSTCNTGSPVVVDSAAATVTVCVPPAIAQQPIPVHGTAGVAASLQVVATGTELTYQWYRGAAGDTNNAVNNATSASFGPTVSQTTDYWVKVSGRCGSVNSNTVRVSIAPVINTQPVGGSVTQGTTRTLSVAATGSYLTYQWYSGAGTGSPVSGATNASFTTPQLNADAGYWVRVSSGSHAVDSALATLTVCQPRTVGITYSTKISGSSVTLQASAQEANETFEWYQGASGVTTTLLGTGSYVSVSPLQTTDYWLRTKRPTCDADSPAVTVRVCTPKINVHPQGGSTLSGTTMSLSVTATGTGPLAYQWYRGAAGDTSQPAGTTNPFTTPALTSSTSYWVRVSSPAQSGCTVNSADSQVATINVCNVPAISSISSNKITTSGSSVTLSVTATGGSLNYEWHSGAAGSGPVVGTNSSSLTVAPTATTTYWVRVYNGCGTVNSTAVQVSVYPVITQQPADVAACNNGTAHFALTATGSGLSYAWYRQYPGQSAVAVGGNNPYVDLTATAAATVYCRVTSGDAVTVSSTVNLTVSPSPANYTLVKAVYSPTQWKLTATVAAADEGLVQYEWYRGALGDTTNRISVPVNANLVVVTPPSLPQTYWVRVKYIDTGCPNDKAITVQ